MGFNFFKIPHLKLGFIIIWRKGPNMLTGVDITALEINKPSSCASWILNVLEALDRAWTYQNPQNSVSYPKSIKELLNEM